MKNSLLEGLVCVNPNNTECLSIQAGPFLLYSPNVGAWKEPTTYTLSWKGRDLETKEEAIKFATSLLELCDSLQETSPSIPRKRNGVSAKNGLVSWQGYNDMSIKETRDFCGLLLWFCEKS